jgi:hypothetical protein
VTWKCRFCCKVYHRNTPQANTCHDKKENYIRFVQATGERGKEADDIMEMFKLTIPDLIIDKRQGYNMIRKQIRPELFEERGEGRNAEEIDVRKGKGKVLAQIALNHQTHQDQVVQAQMKMKR